MGELPNERVDLPEGERHGWPAFEIAAKEAIRRHAEIEGGLGRIVDDRGAVFSRE